jgi:hypothetical protein
MISEVQHLQNLDFSMLKKPRHNYATQEHISQDQVDLEAACLIHYGLHLGMMIQYLEGEYIGENRDAKKTIREGNPFITKIDVRQNWWVLTQGCPSCLIFDEATANELSVIQKGNQQTFLKYPDFYKEEENSHIIALRDWTVLFSPYLCATPQGMGEKHGKFRVIFDSSTQTTPDETVSNHITNTDPEAVIDFGQAKII